MLDEQIPQSQNQIVTENFNEIELDEIEIEEALRLARERKHYRLKEIAYRESLTRKPVYPAYTADELEGFYKNKFEIDEENREVVLNILQYFTSDPRFNGNLEKGLFLMGGVGVGKTTLMRFFCRNQKRSFKIESCREAESKFAQDGDEYLHKLSHNIPIAINSDPFGHTEIGFCFDDLGTEANGKHFGKEKNVMAEILLNRYDNDLPYASTHVTTNLTANEIKEQYGSRVTDRIREMFNIIQFPVNAKSRRKK